MKRYYGPAAGWLRYLLTGLKDIAGPENEWRQANLLEQQQIKAARPVAFGLERTCCLMRRALVITLKMDGERLEDAFAAGMTLEHKIRVMEQLAAFAGRFHAQGFSHQDFYLCHLFWNEATSEIGLIDLQRIRRQKGLEAALPLRWLVKDLAQLDYSCRRTLSQEEYSVLKEVFVSGYAKYLPIVKERRTREMIHKKVQRIARHDSKLRARRKQPQHFGR
ncbi:MAG: hypothetical protein JRJ12_12305 [Deltaproteobacteria bacterium]|nr:hypothetical protein [Deltaproteobacteria bacterium]MBW2069996.1 hypothetical protein [Deltaproteobacteria bacterium]